MGPQVERPSSQTVADGEVCNTSRAMCGVPRHLSSDPARLLLHGLLGCPTCCSFCHVFPSGGLSCRFLSLTPTPRLCCPKQEFLSCPVPSLSDFVSVSSYACSVSSCGETRIAVCAQLRGAARKPLSNRWVNVTLFPVRVRDGAVEVNQVPAGIVLCLSCIGYCIVYTYT